MDGCFWFLLFLFTIASFVIALVVRKRMGEAEAELRALRAASELAHERIRAIENQIKPARAAAAEAEPAFAAAPEQAPPAPIVEPPPAPIIEPIAEPIAEPIVEPLFSPASAFVPPSQPAPEELPAPWSESVSSESLPHEPPPTAAPPPPTPPPPPAPSFDWESLVGVKLFSWIAGVALALAAVFFLKYSVEHGWLRPSIRLAIGLITGTALLVVCELRVARRYRTTANAMDAAGIAILYATLYAAHAIWHLVPPLLVFALMALVTGIAVLLSIRRDSVFIALLGLVGGFATPALLSSGEDRPISLFSYLLLLNAGLAWVAYKKRWPVLGALTLIFTTLYQWMWVTRFLDSSKLPLAIAIFLVFPIVAIIAFWLGRREVASSSAPFEGTAAASAALPILFAIYGASVPAYGGRYVLLFFFLLCLDIGLATIAAARRGPETLHLMAGVSTVLTFLLWISVSYRPAAWPGVLGWVAAFIVIYAAVPEILDRLGRPFQGAGRRAVLVAPILLFIFPVLAAIEPRAAAPAILFGALLVLVVVLTGFALRYSNGWLYRLAALLTLATEASWSARHLNADRLLVALVLYAGFALFFLGVPFAARHLKIALEPPASSPALPLLSIALLFFLTGSDVANAALWGIAILLMILNAGVFAETGLLRNPLLVAAAGILSWLVLGVWWGTAEIALLLIPSMIALTGFTLLLIAGNLWLRRDAAAVTGSAASSDGETTWVALAVYFFLATIAARPALSIPPWPLLAVLFLLALAFGVAALYARQPNLLLASLIASQMVLVLWEVVARVSPWPSIAVYSALVLALMGLSWMKLSRSRPTFADFRDGFARATVATLFLAQLVIIVAAELRGAPRFFLILPAHLGLVIAILAVCWLTEWHAVSVLAAASTALAYFLWRAERFDPSVWWQEFVLATALYLTVVAYPLVLGRRVSRHLDPYLAAVLAGIPYFFFARTSLTWNGAEGALGLLPVSQAGLMLILLIRLLRIEPPHERVLGRLALVAAAVLAFVTVAIPLQLDREWITIGWALEAAALVWLYLRIPHPGLLAWSTGLFAVVFVRLVLNPAVLSYHPRGAVQIWNWYLYTYLIPALAFFAGAWLLREPEKLKLKAALNVAGTILLFLLLNIEIADFYSKGPTITFNFSAGLAQDLTYTLGWALFSICLLITGIIATSRATRIASLGLLIVSVLKCFLHDLMRLGGLYRVGSLVGLAISLAFVALLLQRFVMSRKSLEEEVT